MFKYDDDNKLISYIVSDKVLVAVALITGLVFTGILAFRDFDVSVMVLGGCLITLTAVFLISLRLNPDRVAARQTKKMLDLANSMLELMHTGYKDEEYEDLCKLLLSSTTAIAISITNKTCVLGYAGENAESHPYGKPIRTKATKECIQDGKTRVLLTAKEIDIEYDSDRINAAIVVPLKIGDDVQGALKFYYSSASKINETQLSIVRGFSGLISSQMAAVRLEDQQQLAAAMELKALQNQINPHFLFNTINTIASLIRTDPARARILLREFAVFYRRTLEDSKDKIELFNEMDQVHRYFAFEIARFGEDRLKLDIDIDREVEDVSVPSFLIQPLIENAVRHAMPSEGLLKITVCAHAEGNDVVVKVSDNGVGMSKEQLETIFEARSSKGLGIALNNVRSRVLGYFGQDASMSVDSVLLEGTTVTLVLKNALRDKSF